MIRNSKTEGDASRQTERRRQARYTLILRVGVLEQYGKSSLCLVKNISSAGVQLKCYSQPVVEGHASIRVADETPVPGRILWLEDVVAGMNFNTELNAEALLRVRQKLRPQRRRSTPRVNVQASACLRSGGRIYRAVVCDISSMGVRVRTTSPLAQGDRAIVTLAGLRSLDAYVRWTSSDEAGLVFETPIPMQVIAHWIEGRVRLAS